jgi:hypothetical protein
MCVIVVKRMEKKLRFFFDKKGDVLDMVIGKPALFNSNCLLAMQEIHPEKR